MPLERKIEDMLHAFFLEQLNQSNKIRQGHARTDEGYYTEMRKLIKKIIQLCEDEN